MLYNLAIEKVYPVSSQETDLMRLYHPKDSLLRTAAEGALLIPLPATQTNPIRQTIKFL
jgi:hypothetical protein